MFIVRWEIERNSISQKLPGMLDPKFEKIFTDQVEEMKRYGAVATFDITVDGLLYTINFAFETKSQWESYMKNRLNSETFSKEWAALAGVDYDYDEKYSTIQFTRGEEIITINRKIIEETS